VGGLSFAFGCFVFAYFYLRSLNSHGRWHPAGFTGPQAWAGALLLIIAVLALNILARLVLSPRSHR